MDKIGSGFEACFALRVAGQDSQEKPFRYLVSPGTKLYTHAALADGLMSGPSCKLTRLLPSRLGPQKMGESI